MCERKKTKHTKFQPVENSCEARPCEHHRNHAVMGKKCTKKRNARAEWLFCSLNIFAIQFLSSRCRRFENYRARGPQNSSLSFTTREHFIHYSHPLVKLLKFYLFKGSWVCPSLQREWSAKLGLFLATRAEFFHSVLRPFPS